MSGICVELGPYADHDFGVQGMYGVYHSFRVGETLQVEFVASPGIFRPVVPVDDDVVERNSATAELAEYIQQFAAGIVFFAALPESHRPFGHDLRFACQCTVSTDHFIHGIAVDKVIVDFITHFAE